MIKLAKTLSLPLDAVTQTFGIIARKGAGKTYAAMKLAEELYRAGAPFVVLDPVGNWWGLRVDADGVSPGLAIPVFGGEHGDVSLTPDAGSIVAKIIVERHIPAVLDVSAFRKNERKKFVTEFAEELFHQAKKVRSPRLIIFEEAQVFAPQHAKGEERMLGAVEDIVRLGRNYGLGSALLSQRPQSVNKEVLNQVECLLVGQLNAHHEREAIKNWIVEKGTSLDYLGDLPSLPRGTMFLWSPQWLGKFERIEIAVKKTYDASATPKLGERMQVRDLAPVDIDALNQALEKAIGKAIEEDPKRLRARIVELEKKLAEKTRPVSDEDMKLFTEVAELIERNGQQIRAIEASVRTLHARLLGTPVPPPAMSPPSYVEQAQYQDRQVFKAIDDPGGMPKVERMMLAALAQNDPRPLSKVQVAIFAGYSPKSSSVVNGLGAMRSRGHIEGGNDSMRATPAGKKALGRFQPLPTGPALAETWYAKLDKADRSMLQAIVDSYPSPLNKDQVAKKAGYSPASSSVVNGLGKLRSLHLIEGRNNAMVAHENLIH